MLGHMSDDFCMHVSSSSNAVHHAHLAITCFTLMIGPARKSKKCGSVGQVSPAAKKLKLLEEERLMGLSDVLDEHNKHNRDEFNLFCGACWTCF